MDHDYIENAVSAKVSALSDAELDKSLEKTMARLSPRRLYDRRKSYHVKHPWVKYVCWARRRCSPVESRWKPFYFDRGIECRINAKDTKKIWFRDRAEDLARPSLDRICPKFGYYPWNIRFIEFVDNVRMSGGRF